MSETQLDLAELKRLAQAATPGPWRASLDGSGKDGWVMGPNGASHCLTTGYAGGQVMHAILFALVDAVLASYVVTAEHVVTLSDLTPRRRESWAAIAESERDNLGWWRSLWPLGGGA